MTQQQEIAKKSQVIDAHPLQALGNLIEEAARTRNKMATGPTMTRAQLQHHLADTVLGFALHSVDLIGSTIYELAQEVEHLGAKVDGSDEAYITTVEALLGDTYDVLQEVLKIDGVQEDLKKRIETLQANIDAVLTTDDESADEDEGADDVMKAENEDENPTESPQKQQKDPQPKITEVQDV